MSDWDRGAQPACDDPTANLAPGGAGFCPNEYTCEREGCQKAKVQLALMERERKKQERKKGEAMNTTPEERSLALATTPVAEQEVAVLREVLRETLKAMVELEAKSLRHHRYREPLLTALTMRAGIDKILKALRKYPQTQADGPKAHAGHNESDGG